MMGLYCRSEVRIAAGRIDTLAETKNHVYCFEFKLNGGAEEALKQIDSKNYLRPGGEAANSLSKRAQVLITKSATSGSGRR
jgi:hypothetical protein